MSSRRSSSSIHAVHGPRGTVTVTAMQRWSNRCAGMVIPPTTVAGRVRLTLISVIGGGGEDPSATGMSLPSGDAWAALIPAVRGHLVRWNPRLNAATGRGADGAFGLAPVVSGACDIPRNGRVLSVPH